MTTLAFDTLKYANRLKAANVPPAQAEAEAEALAEILEVNMKELVTKEDLHREITGLRKDMEAKFEKMELRMTAKLGSIVVIAIGAVAAIVKLL